MQNVVLNYMLAIAEKYFLPTIEIFNVNFAIGIFCVADKNYFFII